MTRGARDASNVHVLTREQLLQHGVKFINDLCDAIAKGQEPLFSQLVRRMGAEPFAFRFRCAWRVLIGR